MSRRRLERHWVLPLAGPVPASNGERTPRTRAPATSAPSRSTRVKAAAPPGGLPIGSRPGSVAGSLSSAVVGRGGSRTGGTASGPTGGTAAACHRYAWLVPVGCGAGWHEPCLGNLAKDFRSVDQHAASVVPESHRQPAAHISQDSFVGGRALVYRCKCHWAPLGRSRTIFEESTPHPTHVPPASKRCLIKALPASCRHS